MSDDVALFRLALFAQTPRVWATPLLVAINVAVFCAMVISGVSVMSPTGESLIAWGANYGPRTTAGEWWRLTSNTFIHIGVIHLAMNMIGLWQVGALVERLLGNRSFVLVYFVAGLCGSLASIAWHPFVISAGASGAVFGVYGVLVAYLVRHRGSIPRAVLLDLQKTTLFFIGFNVIFGLQQKGIDMAAHVGGLLGGFAAALVVARPLRAEPAGGTARRELLLVSLTLVLVAAAALLLPRTMDIQKALADFKAVEQSAVDTYNTALEGRRANRLSDADLATLVDEQVLPPWRRYQQQIGRRGHLPPAQAKHLDNIAQYLTLREQGWSTFSQALRHGDDTKAAESLAFHQRAEALLKATAAAKD